MSELLTGAGAARHASYDFYILVFQEIKINLNQIIPHNPFRRGGFILPSTPLMANPKGKRNAHMHKHNGKEATA